MKPIDSIIVILILFLIPAGMYNLFALFCVWEFFVKKKQESRRPKPEPVSVIKPLKGIDPEFKENLKTFCSQDYPEYEVLLGFTDPTDSAIPRVEEIAASYTDCGVRTIISAKDLGANKKVSNLQGLVESAKYPLLAISDSDMRVDRTYLRNIVGEYTSDKNIGLVTCLYKISNPDSMGTALESLTIALDFIPSVLVARRLEGVTFGLGASMLLSKKGIEDIGGVAAIADYLADDYQIGYRLWKKGYTVILSDVVIENIVGPMSIIDYVAHQLRWARTYRASRPRGFVGYGITHLFPISLLLLFVQGPTVLALSILSIVVALRLSLAFVLHRRVIRSKRWLKWLALIPVKDLVSFGIWAWSFLSRNVSWRGRSYKIVSGGKIEEV
jgi:ceramide glucosyltransferase